MARSGKFLFGALFGAAAAALLTPLTGKKARKKVIETANKAGIDKEKLEETAEAIASKGSDLLKRAQKEVSQKTKNKK